VESERGERRGERSATAGRGERAATAGKRARLRSAVAARRREAVCDESEVGRDCVWAFGAWTRPGAG
jgi:hypothetical protein